MKITKNITERRENYFKPSDFLRGRRPEQYSDSIVVEESPLNIPILEQHFLSITGHSEEQSFEYFSRKLLEKEVCPNLMSQVGPTGGGDGKTDSETYPVAEEIAIRWYHGGESATEKWAFAISAQKTWKTKIKKDVESIMGTGRGYSKIFYVSNQRISSKERVEMQDKLRLEYENKVEVVIFGLGWIVDKIIKGNLYEMVTEHFVSVRGLEFKPSKKTGPNDAKREVELADLESAIQDANKYQGAEFQLAEDCLRAAVLACQLERPQEKVEGLFARAIKIAKRLGIKRQILRFLYQRTWKCYFTYDDFDELINSYDEIEKLALESEEAYDLELFTNLFNLLFTASKNGHISEDQAKINFRSEIIKKKLSELEKQGARPNNSLYARTLLVIHEMQFCLIDKDLPKVEKIFKELGEIFKEAGNYGSYPFESYARIVVELGDILTGNTAFEELYDLVQDESLRRSGEGEKGSLLITRGQQQLKAGKTYEAIKFLGKAQTYLIKDEYSGELARSLAVCGRAYQEAGLFWAARSNILSALSISMKSFEETSVMPRLALSAAISLVSLELRLGRVAHLLFGVRLINFIALQIGLDEQQQQDIAKYCTEVDLCLGILLLKANYQQLQHMQKLPHVLEKELFYFSADATLFALGEVDVLKESEGFKDKNTEEEVNDFFELLSSQPASEDLPDAPELFLRDGFVVLKSNVLGCNLLFEVQPNPTSILIAETFLAATESFLATSLNKQVIPYQQELKVKLTPDSAIKGSSITITDDALSPFIEVKHAENFKLDSKESILKFRDNTCFFITKLLPKIAIFPEMETYFKTLAEDENVFGRALTFSDMTAVSNNIFGNLEWVKLSEWTDKITEILYTLKRSEQWIPKNKKQEPKKEKLRRGEGPAPKGIFDFNKKHGDFKVLSIINVPLWDKASWSGTCFASYGEQYPPVLGLGFENEEAAKAIFQGWNERFGRKDINHEIRIAVIKGIDKNNPAHYAVHICANVESSGVKGGFWVASRINIMTPNSTENLDRFLKERDEKEAFYVVPAVFNRNTPEKEPKFLMDESILKNKIIVKWAWEIGENDEDFAALQIDCEPIIPAHITNPPVLKALGIKRKYGTTNY